MISLVLEYKKLVKEVGDLNNINSYNFIKNSSNKYSFKTEDKLGVIVTFTPFDENDCKELNISYPAYNISYFLEGVETQYQKTNYEYLIKILKTVFDISIDWINNNPKINNITLFASNKNKDTFLTKTDPQKSKLYKIIFIKNINKLPGGNWDFKTINVDEDFYQGLLIYRKNNI